jgi:hypothetical protein
MEFEFCGLGRDHGDVAKAVAAARPRPCDRLDKAVIGDHVMGHEEVKNRLFAVVDVGAAVVPFHVGDDQHGTGDVVRPLFAQHPSGMAFPVPICRRLGPAARLQVLEEIVNAGRDREREKDGRGGLSSHLARVRPTLPAWKGSRHVSIPRTWRPTSR